MKLSTPTRSSLVSAIRSSTAHGYLPVGKSIHAHIIKFGFLPETQLYNHILNLYSKTSDFISARTLFDEMPDRNLVSFSTLISGYSQSETPIFALKLIPQLQKQDLTLNQFVFSSLILSCSKLKRVDEGKQIHAQVIISDFESDPFVKTSLIDMYAKFNDIFYAVSIFNSTPCGDPVMYNSMISGFLNFGSYEEALELFAEARKTIDLKPSEFTFGSVIKASSYLRREVGEQIHGFTLKTGFDSDCFVGTSLIDLYSKLNDMESSKRIFESIEFIDLALYNSMIVGFTNNGHHETALECFNKLILEGFDPNGCTFSSVLKAIGGLKCLDLGRIIHGVMVRSEVKRDLVIDTALIDMYMKCGCVVEGCRLFSTISERNTILYNSMIFGLVQSGNSEKAVRLFIEMNRQGIDPNNTTFIALMNSGLELKIGIYTHVIKWGLGLDLTVQNAYLDCLIKGGLVEEAQRVFNKMKERDVVSWTTILSGLSQMGLHWEALKLFKEMNSSKACPNSFTFSTVLKACGSIPDLEEGRCIHGCSIKHGIMDDEFINSSLLDMYAKCGTVEESYRVFNEMPKRDLVLWNTMISAYAQHGNGREALKLFENMEIYEVKPDEITFTSLLSSCSHCGLIEDGIRVFKSMRYRYRIEPSMEHYVCMVDMFGRAGMLEKAEELIKSMPYEADVLIWRTFLGACKLHGNVELAKLARDSVLSMEGRDNVTLVLMSNIYSELGMWEDVERVRRRMREGGERKEPGVSWLQTKGIS